MEKESNIVDKVVLTKPYFSSEGDELENYRPPNFLKQILSFFGSVRIGSDFSTIQLPAHFNTPKSQLQCYGETMYSVKPEILGQCNRGESPIERLIAVTVWNISILQPITFGTAPYNPILGETHHVSRGPLNVLLEQISHNPPVTALHATDEEENLEILWCQRPVAKFYGTSIKVEVHGKRKLKLLNHGETYLITAPKLLVNFFPLPGIEWTGKLKTQCLETGLEAELTYGRGSFLDVRRNPRSIVGNIIDSATSKPLFNIDGHWDRTISLTDLSTNETRVIYNAKEVTSGLKIPIVKDPKGIWASESTLVWSEVSRRILNKDWAKATKVKKAIEENQRKLRGERHSSGESWKSKNFVVTYDKETGWDCYPIQNLVPPAPIVVP